jgi:ABC-type Fe3+/spermidine/putrescine transport system ATPase subunit
VAAEARSLGFHGVAKAFGDVPALRPLSLDIAAGEFVTLLGPSGSGKTTLLNIAAGFVVPDSGTLSIGEAEVTSLPPRKRDIGMVFQSYALFPHMTVFDNIGYGLRVRGVANADIKRRVDTALAMVQLEGYGRTADPAAVGGPAAARCARAGDGDRARSAADGRAARRAGSQLRKQVQLEIRRLHREFGRTTLYVTHDQEEALVMSDRIGIMRNGRIEQIGAPHDLYRRPANVFVAAFLGESNILRGTVVDSAAGSARLAATGLDTEITGPCAPGVVPGSEAAAIFPARSGHVRRSGTTGIAGTRRRGRLSRRTSRRAPQIAFGPGRLAPLLSRRRRPHRGPRRASFMADRGCPHRSTRRSTQRRRTDMLSRRRALQLLMGASAASAFPTHRSFAQGRPFTFCSFGGALSATEKAAFMDPASKKFGAEIANVSPTNYAKIKAMVEAKAVEWDLVDVGGQFIYQGRDQDCSRRWTSRSSMLRSSTRRGCPTTGSSRAPAQP